VPVEIQRGIPPGVALEAVDEPAQNLLDCLLAVEVDRDGDRRLDHDA